MLLFTCYILSLIIIHNYDYVHVQAKLSNNDIPYSNSILNDNNDDYNILNKHISHFEALDYDHNHVLRRARRDLVHHKEQQLKQISSDSNNNNNNNNYDKNNNLNKNKYNDYPIKINFKAHNRHFNIRLKPDVESVFSSEATIENGHGDSIKHLLDHDLFSLTGHLRQYPHNSLVYGSLKKGVFEGKIHTDDNEIYYVERARKYLDDLKEHNPKFVNITKPQDLQFHSVIYSSQHVKHPHHDDGHNHYNEDQLPIGEATNFHIDQTLKPLSLHNKPIDQITSFSNKPSTSSCGQQNEQVKKWLKQISSSAVPGSEYDEYYLENQGNVDGANKSQEDLFYERMSHMFEYSKDGKYFNLSSPINKIYFNNDKDNQFETKLGEAIKTCDSWSKGTCLASNQNKGHPNKTTIANEQQQSSKDTTRNKRQADSFFDFNIYREQPAKRISSGLPTELPASRQKRACTLYIQTDTYLWNHTRRHHDNDLDTREDIASLVAQHIKAVNHIYENTDFGGIRGLKFIVQRLRINDTSACVGQRRETNPFCQPNIDVSNFLNLNSQFNHNDFCLAYIFTYRDFTGGTLGLAWVASTSGASGGICEKYKSYTENINGRQVQTKRSLNTGIITFVNYNSRVPPKVSELTLAHEIGHNFGSPHDFPPECRPGGPQGNYIMYSSATSGERSNNNKFSGCSIKNISQVVHAVLSSDDKNNCFEEDNGPFCGNKIVEDGEECDCGYNAQECTEQCCVPREIFMDPSGNQYGGSTSCQRIRGKQCSPSEGPCCSDECTFAGFEKLCRLETECSHQQTCDNRQATCPLAKPKENMTECNNGTQVCMNGKCGGSICMKYGMEECFLTSKTGAKAEDMCEVACQLPDKPNTCRRTSDINEMKHMSGLKLRPGSPCNEFLGYCDVFQICRNVDPEGPLARLKNAILNPRTLTTIKQWAITHWWVCALAAIAFMMTMYLFIGCCAVHTPSSNPNKRPALRISETIRHPTHTLRRKRRSHGHHHSNHNHSNHNHPHRQHRRHHPHSSGASGSSSSHVVGSRHSGRSRVPGSSRPREGYLFSA